MFLRFLGVFEGVADVAEDVFLGHFGGVLGVLNKCLNSRHLGIEILGSRGHFGVFFGVLRGSENGPKWSKMGKMGHCVLGPH